MSVARIKPILGEIMGVLRPLYVEHKDYSGVFVKSLQAAGKL